MKKFGFIKCFLPTLVVMLWLIFVGLAVWQRVERTEQPPIYDAQNYVQKAKNFWNNFHQDEFINPLNLEPTYRPPGTVLMSHPFGFNGNLRGFIFRSVFLPIICFVSAVYLIGYSRRMGNSGKWNLALIAVFLSTLPMFYHFELSKSLPSPGFWGLVDNFLAGVAALTVAAFMRSVKHCSLGWLIAAALFASLCILVKPVGGLIMVLGGLSWLIAVIFCIRSVGQAKTDQKKVKGFLLLGLAIISIIYVITLFTCFSSKYLSPGNLSYGRLAVAILKSEYKSGLSITRLGLQIHISFGEVLPLFLVTTGLLTIIYWRRFVPMSAGSSKAVTGALTAAALLFLSVGIWFWLAGTSVETVRYFFPFALMTIICAVPLTMQIMEEMPRLGKVSFRVLCILPAVNLALLLGQPHPPWDWQRRTGVNLSTGTYKEEIKQAKNLINRVRGEGKDSILYSLFSGIPVYVFDNVLSYESLISPSEPNLDIRSPVTWQRPTTYILDEILDSDYIIFEPVRILSDKTNALSQKSIQTFNQEFSLIHAWFTDLKGKNGVTIISETPSVRLLKVDERAKLEASLEELRKRYLWRSAFLEANSKQWMSRQDITDLSKKYPLVIQDIQFDKVFKVHALSLDLGEKETTLRIWWEQMHNNPQKKWTFFFQLIDPEGNIFCTKEMLANLKPESADHKIGFITTKLKYAVGKQLKTFAFGIYQPAGNEFLPADKGLRGNDSTRVWIPLPLVSSRISISSNNVTEIISQTDSKYRDITFGNKFILLGANMVNTADRLQIQFVWKSMTKQKLSFNIAVHLLDGKGNLLSQLDYPQSKARSIVEAGAQWLDRIDIPNSRLENVVSIGIAIYSGTYTKLLPIDKGPRDCDGKRMLITLLGVH